MKLGAIMDGTLDVKNLGLSAKLGQRKTREGTVVVNQI